MIVPYDYMQKLTLLIITFLSYCKYIRLANGHKRRRIWTKDIFDQNERDMHGFYNNLFLLMKEKDNDQFHTACRMGVPQFKMLFKLLERKLTKYSPRTPIQAECRLVLTITFLAQGSSWQSLAWAFRLGVSTVRQIILETCDVIWEELREIYLIPPSKQEWRKIANDVYNATGMPNCVGAIDSRHIPIKCPAHSESLYKGYRSVVLLAACDSNYCFTAVDISANDSNDPSFLANGFGRNILGKEINLPEDDFIPNSDVKFPHYFAADETFPLKNHIMRPYSHRNLPNNQISFNKKLSSVHGKIENTFGIMTSKWRILLNFISCFPHNAEKIVKAIVVLHNFANVNDVNYCPSNFVDHIDGDEETQGLWRQEKFPTNKCKLFTRFNAPRSVFALRDTLKDHLCQSE